MGKKIRKSPGARVGGIRMNVDHEVEIITSAVKIYKLSGEPVTAKMVSARTGYNVQIVNKWLTRNTEMFSINFGHNGEKQYTPREIMI